ncbi:M20/M25/M40 family metallo-hydrolase [Desulforhopalus sp. IMCC35007]|uniref:M20/M25/M40 family metallo-hydrolase n=1 Tax=Desulforhopalus sp. IMCC35007 TaxID=2569543 RepID=UPI0010AE19AE|nr:M20/M25/M40 family metallo-hydrolase [Desulforhopalus sp. IMCC35007]TKB09717.1 M20/M25/M40 family metallo-hydrolase [Desulforhopalus sp. IMCC35007]
MSDMSCLPGLAGLDKKIFEILKEYCRIPSITGTSGETLIPEFFKRCLGQLPYYVENPDHLGTWAIEKDSLNRQVCWAMIRGGSEKTCVLIHHSDVVVTENYGRFQDLALDPDRLEAALKADPRILDQEAKKDLLSGLWLFGRGTADMKGGGAIQLALFDTYGRMSQEERKDLPTLIVLAVPDEENLSSGMRAGVGLLCHLQEQFGLDYRLMINCEPHQRLSPERGLISQGSIGKLNLFVYVRGVMAHAGKVLEGINPTGLMAAIATETDLSEDFVDHFENETSIPPTWIFLRDLKSQYDISFPEASYGMFNVLNFHTGPGEVLAKMMEICERSLIQYIAKVSGKRGEVSRRTGQDWPSPSWQPRVVLFGELRAASPAPPAPMSLEEELGFRTREFFPEDPLIVIGLCPPYYPGVSNSVPEVLREKVCTFAKEKFGQEYDNQAYYTGISDLSYAMSAGETQQLSSAMAHMAAEDYQIPFEQIEQVSMNCINLGPWGKDFHKPSERVLKEDLFHRTPMLVDHIIRTYNS